MKTSTTLLCALFAVFCVSCTNTKLISDHNTLRAVENRLALRADWLPAIPTGLSVDESQALMFLYAYLPVGDVADYSVAFFLANVRGSLEARAQMPWGSVVPEREFLHFVLPVRVNNEALDTSRVAFFAQLKDRVRGLSMKDAILEVNHWCHEKVNYSPSDGRTMSPLALAVNSTGRCGEESTFTVAALRSVGIPARQIYVPRWAHADDNHAWVEAWAADEQGQGQWYYLGACEPEPVLNTGWFDAPAKRSMMMLTKVFGQYSGEEEVLTSSDGYTEISVTSNYAPTKAATVVVHDSYGNPVEGAEVLYTIYNYASYYPAARKLSDSHGASSLTAGLGDMVVFASKDNLSASGILDFRTADTLLLTLGSLPAKPVEIDIVPPAEQAVSIEVSDQDRQANNCRFTAEDSMRTAYNKTFIDHARSNQIAAEIGADTTRLWDLMSVTRGNYEQIVTFLLNIPRENVAQALDLLDVISLKDMRDTPASVLLDHLNASLKFKNRPFYKEYILNPRLDNELLTPYRSALEMGDTTTTFDNISAKFVELHIKICDSLNPAKLAISPLGVYKLKMGDQVSIDRLLLAMLRSNGIAARREPLSKRMQYYNGKEWIYIQNKNNDAATIPQKGKLMITHKSKNIVADPKLDTHFSLSKWNGSSYVLVEFESLGVDMGGDATLSKIFSAPLEMEQGDYMLTTGTRISNGKVLARNEPIKVKKDSLSKVELVMRSSTDELSVIGAINPETLYTPQNSDKAKQLIATTGRGYFMVAMIDAKKEPTTHLLRALAIQKPALEKWGRPIVLILRDKSELQSLDLKDFPALPSTVSFGYDNNKDMSSMIGRMCEVNDMNRKPVLVVGDSFGRVVYVSTGYNTSIGEQLNTIVSLL